MFSDLHNYNTLHISPISRNHSLNSTSETLRVSEITPAKKHIQAQVSIGVIPSYSAIIADGIVQKRANVLTNPRV